MELTTFSMRFLVPSSPNNLGINIASLLSGDEVIESQESRATTVATPYFARRVFVFQDQNSSRSLQPCALCRRSSNLATARKDLRRLVTNVTSF